jgi:hypothetical protein
MSAVLATSGQFGGFNSYAEWFNSKFSNTSSFFVDLKDRFNQTLALFNPNIQSTIRANLNIAHLPCEDWICQGVKEVFGLSYGGGDHNNQNCANLARNKLTSWQQQERHKPAA